jgi:hypothetical protein
MPSSKGKPTDPKLREKVKEGMSTYLAQLLHSTQTNRTADVKAETNKNGSGKGQWSAWKVRFPSPILPIPLPQYFPTNN